MTSTKPAIATDGQMLDRYLFDLGPFIKPYQFAIKINDELEETAKVYRLKENLGY